MRKNYAVELARLHPRPEDTIRLSPPSEQRQVLHVPHVEAVMCQGCHIILVFG